MIRRGQVIRFEVSGSAGGYVPTSADAVRSAMTSELGKDFIVKAMDFRPGGAAYEIFDWPFRADITLQMENDYGDINGPSSIVAHDVYEATGYMPQVSAPAIEGVGQPDLSDDSILPDFSSIGTTIADAIAGLGSAVGRGVANATEPAVSEFNKILIVVAAVAIVLVVSVGGKTTRVGL